MQRFRLQVRTHFNYINYTSLLTICRLAVENEHLRALLTYLNDAVHVGDCLPGRTSMRSMVMSEFARHQQKVIALLAAAPGKIHFSADIWTARNRKSLLGINAHFMDAQYAYKSIVLALPELLGDHAGTDIKDVVTQIFKLFGIRNEQVCTRN